MRRQLSLLALVLVVAGCMFEGQEADVESLRDDTGLPMYYAGDSFGGLPLTHAEGWDSAAGAANFDYGTCEIPPGDEGGCPLPIQVQHFRFQFNQWKLGIVQGCFHRPELRGVPTARHDGLVLFTDDIVVKIYARSPGEARKVALALRQVNGPLGVKDPLPAPPADIREAVAEAC